MRSLLFTPADSERKLAKGVSSGADVILIDLEDSIAPEPDAKAAARASAAAFIESRRGKPDTPPFYVRINDLDSGFADDDLAAVVPARPAGIMLPKPRSNDDVRALAGKLDALERDAGLDDRLSILVIAIERPEALLNAASFQDADPRVTGYSWGSEDLAASLGAHSSRDAGSAYREPVALARTLCLCAAASAGVHALDTVYTDFRDPEGLERSALQAAQDGFSGKMAIHPDQVPVINAAFTPETGEIDEARRIVAAFEAEPGAGVINMDGRMVDRPHLEHARKVLQRAQAAGLG